MRSTLVLFGRMYFISESIYFLLTDLPQVIKRRVLAGS